MRSRDKMVLGYVIMPDFLPSGPEGNTLGETGNHWNGGLLTSVKAL